MSLLTTPTPDHTTTATRTEALSFDNGWRGRFNAGFFTAFDRYIAHIGRRHKQLAFGDLAPGTIVEIGPGIGANFEYLPTGSTLVAIEPNRAMHAGLVARATQRVVRLELHAAPAEHLPLPDETVDDVLCSLVLCTVDDPEAVLAEIRRVLRPGGRLRFVEHVAASPWSPRRWLQHTVRRPWRWIYEGCDVCRDTASSIEAAGFSTVEITRRRWRHSVFVPVNTAICGIATK